MASMLPSGLKASAATEVGYGTGVWYSRFLLCMSHTFTTPSQPARHSHEATYMLRPGLLPTRGLIDN